MALHIIIDGYNLIRQSLRLSRLDRRDIQEGREALLQWLASYRKIRPHRMTVVFDGAGQTSIDGARDRFRGINVRYSRSGESADAVIQRMAAREGDRAMVVSSDRAVTSFAAARGCAVSDSATFEERVEMAALMDGKGADAEEKESGWVPTTKKKGPGKRLSKKERKSRRSLEKL